MWGVSDLTVTYSGRPAVSGVSFRLPPGGITVLIGGDGAGKTSVLKTLVGVVTPATGEVAAPPKAQVGYVSAGPGVYRDLTVEENLRFSGRSYGVDNSRLRERIEDLLSRTGLTGARKRLAGQLSGGMRQKLALAMGILHQPQLLVLDEPTTGVDPVSRAELWRLIAQAAAAGTTVLAATSYVDEAERAEQVVVLVEGEVVASGSPEEIVASIPGETFRLESSPQVWRRGGAWRVWSPTPVDLDRSAVGGLDLEDALVIAELVRQRGGRL